MIDYEKLKIAHELANKWMLQDSIAATICICHLLNESLRYILTDGRLLNYYFDNIDELIEKLTEFTKSMEPKYKIGQEVWRLCYSSKDNMDSFIISDIDCCSEEMYLGDDGYWWEEKQLYSTEQELIESQIKYWLEKLEIPDQIKYFATRHNEKCQHEQTAIPEVLYKCIKCGEFYR